MFLRGGGLFLVPALQLRAAAFQVFVQIGKFAASCGKFRIDGPHLLPCFPRPFHGGLFFGKLGLSFVHGLPPGRFLRFKTRQLRIKRCPAFRIAPLLLASQAERFQRRRNRCGPDSPLQTLLLRRKRRRFRVQRFPVRGKALFVPLQRFGLLHARHVPG